MSQTDAHARLFTPLLRAAPSRPFVVGQLGQSLDGRIATRAGAADIIGGPAALDHLHRLRAHVDAVVVGIGTVLADDPRLTVRRVPGRNPVRVVIDPRGRLPATARCLDPLTGGCLIIRAHQAMGERAHPSRPPAALGAGAEIVMLATSDGRLAPAAIVAALFERGLRRILVEGGSRTLSAFIEADCVDRLHVAVAPIIIGSGQAGLDLAGTNMDDALRPKIAIHVLDDGNVLFDCDLRHRP
jgi:diaminohydroxyphosphoribosylaminopyrimidine deaminase/5-amino-6-(5-phosphoribosylamino)uracil reductase